MIDMIFQKHICKDQAELVGMMFGDGNMYNKYNYTYSIRITLNSKKDLDYSEYIIHLFQKLFSINPKIKIIDKKSELSIYLYSKKLIEYFHFELKIPFSPKILSAIPEYIKSDKILLSSFIRELFDTDGCVYIQSDKKYRYYLVKITTKHRLFAIDLKYA